MRKMKKNGWVRTIRTDPNTHKKRPIDILYKNGKEVKSHWVKPIKFIVPSDNEIGYLYDYYEDEQSALTHIIDGIEDGSILTVEDLKKVFGWHTRDYAMSEKEVIDIFVKGKKKYMEGHEQIEEEEKEFEHEVKSAYRTPDRGD